MRRPTLRKTKSHKRHASNVVVFRMIRGGFIYWCSELLSDVWWTDLHSLDWSYEKIVGYQIFVDDDYQTIDSVRVFTQKL